MGYRILADIVLVVHFLWIIFVLVVFVLTLYSFFFKNFSFLDLWFIRTIHLLGIVYVTILNVLDKYCPLTVLENILRQKYNQHWKYPGSFIIYYVEKIVYPEISSMILIVGTMFIAFFSALVYVVYPPKKIVSILKDFI